MSDFKWTDELVIEYFGWLPMPPLGEKQKYGRELLETFKRLRTPKPVLFVTEDGVEIRDDVDYYVVFLSGWFSYEPYKDIIVVHGDIQRANYKDECKTFSTKEKAEEYILMNKPCLSLQEVYKVLNTGDHACQYPTHPSQRLKELAKQKIK